MSTRVWRDYRVKLFNHKLVFTQLTGLDVGDKTRNFTLQLVLQHNVSEQLERFCCLFKGQPFFHDFSRKVSCFLLYKTVNSTEGKKTLMRLSLSIRPAVGGGRSMMDKALLTDKTGNKKFQAIFSFFVL